MFAKELNGPNRVRRKTNRKHQPLDARLLGGQRLLQAFFRRATDRQTSGKIVKQAELAHQSDVRIARPSAVAPTQFEKWLVKRFGHPARFEVLVANDISRQKRQHRAYFVTRNVSIGGAVPRPYLPDLDVIRGSARLRNPPGDHGLGV